MTWDTTPLSQPSDCKHGIKAALDIMDFLIELIKKDPAAEGAPGGGARESTEETIMFALNMIHTGERGGARERPSCLRST